jgi:phosphatidylinositol alpha-1,6-mannosyltransferase
MSKAEYYEAYRDPSDLYKGFKSVVEAVALLRNAGVPAVLELVGDGNARADLEAWVASQAVAPFVKFCGRVSDAELIGHYTRAQVFVLASEGEGFGLVYAEAMAHDLPCIAVAAGAAPEVVTDDESGYVVRPRDSQEIADRLFVLLRNPRAYARLGAGAAERHRTHYTQAAFIQRIVTALTIIA